MFRQDGKKTLTIKYAGTKEKRDKITKTSGWAFGLQIGTTIECQDGTYTLTSGGKNDTWSWTPKTTEPTSTTN